MIALPRPSIRDLYERLRSEFQPMHPYTWRARAVPQDRIESIARLLVLLLCPDWARFNVDIAKHPHFVSDKKWLAPLLASYGVNLFETRVS